MSQINAYELGLIAAHLEKYKDIYINMKRADIHRRANESGELTLSMPVSDNHLVYIMKKYPGFEWIGANAKIRKPRVSAADMAFMGKAVKNLYLLIDEESGTIDALDNIIDRYEGVQ